VARLMRKPKVSYPPPSSPETTTEVSSGLVLNRLPPGVSEVTTLGAKEGASPTSSVFVGGSSRSEPSLAAVIGTVTGTESSSGGESSSPQVVPVFSSRTLASNLFGFPLSPASNLGCTTDPAPYSASVVKFTPLGTLQIPKTFSAPPSLAGAAILGEKLRSPLPVVVCKPFQCYYRKAKKLREGHSLKWNDVLLSDSLEAMKMSFGNDDKRVTGAKPPAEKLAKPPAMKKSVTPVNQGLFRKGFLNLPPIVSVPPVSPQVEINDGVVAPPSPSSGCLNGFSQSRNWSVGFDHNGEIVVWEEEEDDYWDCLPLDWAMDEDFGEEAMAIRDAMEEEFQFFVRQKSKGKRDLLNLHSSINYGDVNYPSRRRKGKAHML
jgi:hypothetical protein